MSLAKQPISQLFSNDALTAMKEAERLRDAAVGGDRTSGVRIATLQTPPFSVPHLQPRPPDRAGLRDPDPSPTPTLPSPTSPIPGLGTDPCRSPSIPAHRTTVTSSTRGNFSPK